MEPSLRTTLRVAQGGRVVIPATVRKRLGMEVGTNLILKVEDDHAILTSVKSARRKACERIRRYLPRDVSLCKQLKAERKVDARRE
jgi:AbrB family looped-hinge helix DNA binding protein